MIDRRLVLDAVLAILADDPALPVHDIDAPTGLDLYLTVEHPPGTPYDPYATTMGEPEGTPVVHVRLRAVSIHADAAASRQAAQHLAHNALTRVLDRSTPISGDGWRVFSRTHVSHGGTDRVGTATNVVDDVSLSVVAA